MTLCTEWKLQFQFVLLWQNILGDLDSLFSKNKNTWTCYYGQLACTIWSSKTFLRNICFLFQGRKKIIFTGCIVMQGWNVFKSWLLCMNVTCLGWRERILDLFPMEDPEDEFAQSICWKEEYFTKISRNLSFWMHWRKLTSKVRIQS